MKYNNDYDVIIGPMFFLAWCGFLLLVRWMFSSTEFSWLWPVLPMAVAGIGLVVFMCVGVVWFLASHKQDQEFFDRLDQHRERILSGKEEYHDYSEEVRR